MSNAEEIAEKHYEEAVEYGGRRSDHILNMKYAMQEHTNQTLQELKEKVELYDEGNPLMPNEFLSKGTVITLIDEAMS